MIQSPFIDQQLVKFETAFSQLTDGVQVRVVETVFTDCVQVLGTVNVLTEGVQDSRYL